MTAFLTSFLAIAILLLVAGLFSLFKAAILASREWRLRGQASRGDRGALAALAIRIEPGPTLSALRLGIVVALSAAGILAGFQVVGLAGDVEGGDRGVLLGAALVTVMLATATFVLTHSLPRRLALHRPERIARMLVRPVLLVRRILGPLARFIDLTVDRILRGSSAAPADRPDISVEEIQRLIWAGARSGVIEEVDAEIFQRVFRFLDRRARAMMTPRDDVEWIDLADSPETIRAKIMASAHSRFLVCDGSLDILLGVVQVKDLLSPGGDGPSIRLRGHLALPPFVYERTRGPQVLETLRKSATHTAVVLDEFGSVVGIITIHDIIEAILGDLPKDGIEDDEGRRHQKPDGSWVLEGRFPLDEFREMFDLVDLPPTDYQTLAGLVLARLGHFPRIGESFEFSGLHFEVSDVENNRVDRVRVRPTPRWERP
ncbi:hemolysin family protein [Aquisphaera insulae]|uniref:hemolysin family protein n=1 Tax=Aquisphaera insulae TaxID=2712864 RepID=UPI0013ECC905|nr:hemolysin family protein [Aquisphaera insulae]